MIFDYHVGKGWNGLSLNERCMCSQDPCRCAARQCRCPKAPCGLVIELDAANVKCAVHNIGFDTFRTRHLADECPGTLLPPEDPPAQTAKLCRVCNKRNAIFEYNDCCTTACREQFFRELE